MRDALGGPPAVGEHESQVRGDDRVVRLGAIAGAQGGERRVEPTGRDLARGEAQVRVRAGHARVDRRVEWRAASGQPRGFWSTYPRRRCA